MRCYMLYNVLWKVCLRPPSSADQWLTIAKDFQEQESLPRDFFTLAGKHIRIPDTGTLFHNYKESLSLVLMAVCDVNCFTMIDIGKY